MKVETYYTASETVGFVCLKHLRKAVRKEGETEHIRQ
jgi:hypothetical protein